MLRIMSEPDYSLETSCNLARRISYCIGSRVGHTDRGGRHRGASRLVVPGTEAKSRKFRAPNRLRGKDSNRATLERTRTTIRVSPTLFPKCLVSEGERLFCNRSNGHARSSQFLPFRRTRTGMRRWAAIRFATLSIDHGCDYDPIPANTRADAASGRMSVRGALRGSEFLTALIVPRLF